MRRSLSTLTALVALIGPLAACDSDGDGSGAGEGGTGGTNATGGTGGEEGTAGSGGAGGQDASGGAGGIGGAGGAGGTGGTLGTGGAGGTGGEAPCVDSETRTCPKYRVTIEGDATWTVTFDDAAKAAGATDCVYTRHYIGTEDASAPWACPSCERIFRASVVMTVGEEDCFSQLSPDAPLQQEWIGFGGGRYFRSGFPTLMSDQGAVTPGGDGFTLVNEILDLPVPAGGTVQYDVGGTFTLGQVGGDPMNGFAPPEVYACGWPRANPPPYEGDYSAADGLILPDALLYDRCSEVVRLHDFKGKYLVVDMSAQDCPPCQAMAAMENAFIERLAADGLEVEVITLMAPSLDDPLGQTTPAMLTTWTARYELTAPVLADRGLGLAMFDPLFGEATGYPSMVVVDPELHILMGMSGFDEYVGPEAAIRAHAAP